MIVAEVDEWTAAHLAAAIRQHRRSMAAHGHPHPAALLDLEAAFTSRARRGPGGATLADPAGIVDDQPMDSVLLTTPRAAELLSLSPRTVKRLVADGRLASVKIGGARRIRRADLDRYAEGL
ncbi:hypothetical protein BH23ACT8_BH23ACT8_15700 [soil metagenome]